MREDAWSQPVERYFVEIRSNVVQTDWQLVDLISPRLSEFSPENTKTNNKITGKQNENRGKR